MLGINSAQLRAVLNRWRLAFSGFALAYTLLLLLSLDFHPIQWTKSYILTRQLLYWGLYDNFILNAFLLSALVDVLEFLAFEALRKPFEPRLVPYYFRLWPFGLFMN
jgi:hypothetical protein